MVIINVTYSRENAPRRVEITYLDDINPVKIFRHFRNLKKKKCQNKQRSRIATIKKIINGEIIR